MIKSFNEMMNVDVTPYVKKRDGIEYLPWHACLELLHACGAENVYWEPLTNKDGSTLFMSEQTFGEADKPEKRNRCYEVRILVTIDDLKFTFNYPLINGTNPVRDNSLTQLRVNNAHQRAFVKAVAVRTGLGLSLWTDDDTTDDLSRHDIFKIKRRVEELLTVKLQHSSQAEVLKGLGVNEKQLKSMMELYGKLDAFEKAVARL